MLECIETGTNKEKIIYLTLTRQCNISCTYCFSGPKGADLPRELDTREWIEVIDQITEAYGPASVIVKGGEPMLRKDLTEILSHIKLRGHFVTLVTNGTLVKDEATAQRLASCVDQMEISLDGTSPDTTDRIKGPGMFKQIMAGIRRIHDTPIKLSLSFVIVKENQHILWEALDHFLKELGEKEVGIRIDNRISFPVDPRNGQGDFFDFLRNVCKLACHGRLGANTSSAELEVDDKGLFHPFCTLLPSDDSLSLERG